MARFARTSNSSPLVQRGRRFQVAEASQRLRPEFASESSHLKVAFIPSSSAPGVCEMKQLMRASSIVRAERLSLGNSGVRGGGEDR